MFFEEKPTETAKGPSKMHHFWGKTRKEGRSPPRGVPVSGKFQRKLHTTTTHRNILTENPQKNEVIFLGLHINLSAT
jgi:hypothetical protein